MLTIDQYSAIVEDALRSLPLPAEPAGLYDPIRYALESGGKRLRPVLTLAVAQALGADTGRALDAALAIEIFHNFTLLHDDVMDKADMRRGRSTVHRRWDERTAILSGDTMLTLAVMQVARSAEPVRHTLMDIFNAAAMEVYEGQQYDMDFETRDDVSEEEYLRMIFLKTSALIGGACALGAAAAGADSDKAAALRAYGDNLGMAFQLQDDYLDTYGDPAVFGKNVGGDILNDKKTWLRIMATRLDTTGTVTALNGPAADPQAKIERVREVYDRLSLPAKCHALIEEYAAKAVEAVRRCGFAPADEKFFTDLALKSCNRTH